MSLIELLPSSLWAVLVGLAAILLWESTKRWVPRLAEQLLEALAGSPLLRRRGLRTYRTQITKRYQYLPAAFSPNRLRMDAVYVPLRLMDDTSPAGNANAELAKAERVVVLGGPGAGKTMLCRHYMLTWAQHLRRYPTPILIELRRYANSGQALQEQIVDEFAYSGFRKADGFVRNALAYGGLTLLLDGLDEVSSKERIYLEDQIRQFSLRYPACRIIVTCRAALYRGQLAPEFTSVFRIAEFDDRDIRRFLHQWPTLSDDRVIDDLYVWIQKTLQLRELAKSPLLLSIIASLYGNTPDAAASLARSRTGFYDEVTNVLLGRLEGSHNEFGVPLKRAVLVRLALAAQNATTATDRGPLLHRKDVLAEILDIAPMLFLDSSDAETLLDEIVHRSGLLVESDEDARLQFAHLSIQEYLTSIAYEYDPEGLLSRYRTNPAEWREVVKLWCGAANRDTGPFIEAVSRIDPALAVECLNEAQLVDESTAARITAAAEHGVIPVEPETADGQLGHAEHEDAIALVIEAFGSAGRPLHRTELAEQLLPGPVWVSTETNPTGRELERFFDQLDNGRMACFVHSDTLRSDAEIMLDKMRVSGHPVATVSMRALRAAVADHRVTLFLGELERDYHKDNLFDTRNALMNERFLFGRDVMLNHIGSALRRNEHVLITGLRKVGKTSLLNVLRQHLVDRPVCTLDLQRYDRHNEEWPLDLFHKMLVSYDRWGAAEHSDWPFSAQFPSTTTELEDELERRHAHISTTGKPPPPLVVVLDEIERVFPVHGEDTPAKRWIRASGALRTLAQGDRRYVVMLGADLRPVAIRENDLGGAGTNPFFHFLHEMWVPLLNREAVTDMVVSLTRAMGVDKVSNSFGDQLFELTGGHPALARMVAGEAYRQKLHPSQLTGTDLEAGLGQLVETGEVGSLMHNNLWQYMTATERSVLVDLARARKSTRFGRSKRLDLERERAYKTLHSQGLVDDHGIRITLFRQWLTERGEG